MNIETKELAERLELYISSTSLTISGLLELRTDHYISAMILFVFGLLSMIAHWAKYNREQ